MDHTDGLPSMLSDTDRAAIYVAVIHRIYLQDDAFGGTLRAPVVYLRCETSDVFRDPRLTPLPPAWLPEAFCTAILVGLADLPARFEWVGSESALDLIRGAEHRQRAVITLGNIHPRTDGSVWVPDWIYVSMLEAGGQTHVARKIDGVWTVSGDTGWGWFA